MTFNVGLTQSLKEECMSFIVARQLWVACLSVLLMGVTNLAQGQTVDITAPSEGANFAVGAAIPLVAAVDDQGFHISLVQFKQNGVLISADSSPPYTGTFTPGVAGSYSLEAWVKDGTVILAISNPVTITVGNTPPTVSLTAPTAGTSKAAPATF